MQLATVRHFPSNLLLNRRNNLVPVWNLHCPGLGHFVLLRRQLIAHGPEFFLAFSRDLREAHVEALQRLQYDMGDEQSGAELVVGWHDVPWRRLCAGGGEAFFVGASVLLPESTLLDVGRLHLPVLLRGIDAVE